MMTLQIYMTLTLITMTLARSRNITCKQRQSCDSGIDQSSLAMNCACDKSCEVIGDCCHDYKPNNMEDTGSSVVAMGTECLNMPLIVGTFGIHISIVTSCPVQFADSSVRERCETVADKLPFTAGKIADDALFFVPVVGHTYQILYMNIYCAICNGEMNTTFLKVDIRNRRPMSIERLISMSDPSQFDSVFPRSKVELYHESYEPRPCRNAADRCDTSWQDPDVARTCQEAPTSYVYAQNVNTYRNKYCALCNHLQPDELSCDDPRQYLNTGGMFALYPYSLLFDLNTGLVIARQASQSSMQLAVTGVYRQNLVCQQLQVYDPFRRKCVSMFCKSVINGKCVEDINNMEYADNGEDKTVPNKNYTIDLIHEGTHKTSVNTVACNMLYLYALGLINKSQADLYSQTDMYQVSTVCMEANMTLNVSSQPLDIAETAILELSASYLTVALNTLSIVGLLVHIVVYSVFPTLRNTPGKCLMCLSACLMTSQLTFTLGLGLTHVTIICYMIAIFLHFISLAYFCWMTVLSFDIWHTFQTHARGIATANNDSNKTFIYYGVLSFGIPVIITLVSLMLDLLHLQISPHYAEHVCYFGQQKALFYLFDIPVAVTIATNTLFLLMTIRNLMAASRGTEIVRAHRMRKERHRFFLYVKLSFIMGITWLTAFIAMATGRRELWYIYIVFNCLQGVWIFIAFVCTRKVFQLLSESCGVKSELKPSSGRFSSQSKTSCSTTRQTALLDSNVAMETERLTKDCEQLGNTNMALSKR